MIYEYPWIQPFIPDNIEFGPMNNTTVVQSVLNAGVQTSETPGKRWACSLVLPATTTNDRASVEGFFDRLNGQAHRLRLWHMGRFGLNGNGSPMGTINTAGVTVKTAAAQFASSFTITGCGAARTLMGGDMLSVNGQLLMMPVTGASDALGDMLIPVSGLLRNALTVGMVVTLIKPTALFILSQPDWRTTHKSGRYSPELAFDFQEVFT